MKPSERIFSVHDYGAHGDGIHPDTIAINAAIRACHVAGGGRVLVSAGTYLTGPIQMQSGVELHLDNGATVIFSRNFDDYPLCLTHFEGQRTVRCTALLWAEDAHDISVTGSGVFDGQGDAWRQVAKSKLSAQEWEEFCARGGVVDEGLGLWWPSQNARDGEALVRQLLLSGRPPSIEEFRPARDFLRPNMVKFVECQNVMLDGPTFHNSPCWAIHFLYCQNVKARRVNVYNPWYAQNGDGFDIESCRDVVISDCFLDVGDDAICLKSGKDEEGRLMNRPCEHIQIKRCTVLHGHGGLTIGSEMSGGVRHVEVSECVFRGTDVGLRFKTTRGRGGIVEDIQIRDVAMTDIRGAAVSLDMYYMGTAWGESEPQETPAQLVDEGTPQFRRISMSNIVCKDAKYAVEMRGLPEMPLADIVLENARFQSENGIVMAEAQNITFREVNLETSMMPAMKYHNVTGLALDRVDCTTRKVIAPQKGHLSLDKREMKNMLVVQPQLIAG